MATSTTAARRATTASPPCTTASLRTTRPRTPRFRSSRLVYLRCLSSRLAPIRFHGSPHSFLFLPPPSPSPPHKGIGDAGSGSNAGTLVATGDFGVGGAISVSSTMPFVCPWATTTPAACGTATRPRTDLSNSVFTRNIVSCRFLSWLLLTAALAPAELNPTHPTHICNPRPTSPGLLSLSRVSLGFVISKN